MCIRKVLIKPFNVPKLVAPKSDEGGSRLTISLSSPLASCAILRAVTTDELDRPEAQHRPSGGGPASAAPGSLVETRGLLGRRRIRRSRAACLATGARLDFFALSSAHCRHRAWRGFPHVAPATAGEFRPARTCRANRSAPSGTRGPAHHRCPAGSQLRSGPELF